MRRQAVECPYYYLSPSPACDVVALLPRTLMWATDGLEFDAVQLRFAQRVSEALRTMLARLRTKSPDLADSITTRLSQASEAVVGRVLLSPSVSQQLLWRGDSAADRPIPRELPSDGSRRRRETAIQNGLPIWGALGNCVVRETGELTRWDPIDGRLPVDLESPDVIALGATLPTEAAGWTPLEREERRHALETLTAAYLRVRRGGASLQALVETCARVVVLRRKPTKLFYSFSSCYSVGRIALVNPQLVSEALIAEALVHEAISVPLHARADATLGREAGRP